MPNPEVVTSMPFDAPSLWTLPKRSRTSGEVTPLGEGFLLGWRQARASRMIFAVVFPTIALGDDAQLGRGEGGGGVVGAAP